MRVFASNIYVTLFNRLFVHFKVAFPDKGSMTLESIAALEALLPPSSHPKATAADIEIVSLSDADIESFGNYGQSGEDESDDEERGGRGGPGVQCAQQ